MRRPVAFMFGLTLIAVVTVHCYSNETIRPGHNRTNDVSEEVVQLKTALKQLKQRNIHMKRQLCRVMNSLRDFQEDRHNYIEASEKAEKQSPELKCIVYTDKNLPLELQSIKMEQDTLNISVSAMRQDLLSTRSELEMIQASENVTGEDVLSIKSELTQVQALLNDTEQDRLSTKSEVTAFNTSLTAVSQDQVSTTSRLSALEERIVQLENARNNVGSVRQTSVNCPDGFRHLGDSCYWFPLFKKTFASAQSICEEVESHLAVITSESENNIIKNYTSHFGKAEYYWLGGSDVASEGEWKWEGGSLIVYADWGPYQPNSYGGEENCLTMAKKYGYQWNDGTCHSEVNFICET